MDMCLSVCFQSKGLYLRRRRRLRLVQDEVKDVKVPPTLWPRGRRILGLVLYRARHDQRDGLLGQATVRA